MKKWGLSILMIAVLLAFTACTPSPQGSGGGEQPIEQPIDQEPNQGGDTVSEDMAIVKLYYANQKYVDTGDDSLDKIILIEKELPLKGKKIEEIIIEELKNPPKAEGLSTALEKLNILGVEVLEDTATVNISSKDLNGGSLEEELILRQLVFSLTELPKVQKVQILIDGKKEETLMGHMEIIEPLTREYLSF